MHLQVGDGDPGRGKLTLGTPTEAESPKDGASQGRRERTRKAALRPTGFARRPGFTSRPRRPRLRDLEELLLWPRRQFSKDAVPSTEGCMTFNEIKASA